ncbi:macrophage colony-stimulating factor 1 isoform X2 [Podarcis lilfordi]|nr:macrophage colony-stimulating factor 1 isoform X2 [Podarcis lilfordi]
MISPIAAAFLLLVAFAIHGTEQKNRGCSRLIHDVHLNRLLDLVDSQMMKPSCELSFEYVDERELDDPKCFLRAAYSPLRNILESIEFKQNTPNSDTMKEVKDWHIEVGDCMEINSSDEEESKHCTRPFSRTARQMLKLVHEYFSKAKEILSKGNFSHDCSSVFEKCSDSKGKSTTSPDKHSEKPEARNTQGMAVTYVVVPSVLGILLAVGGLLFYFHKSRMLARRRLQRNERNLERQEGRPLNRREGDLESQIQEEEL